MTEKAPSEATTEEVREEISARMKLEDIPDGDAKKMPFPTAPTPSDHPVQRPAATPSDHQLQTMKAVLDTTEHSEHQARPPLADRFLIQAKQIVVDNYNSHRDVSRSQELNIEQVYIVSFTKVLGSWKAVVASPVIRGLLWDVTYNGYKSEAYIDIYKKLNNVRIILERNSA